MTVAEIREHERPSSIWLDLVEALGELTELPKTRSVSAGPIRYTYADLGDALSAVRPVLAKHGLAVTQPVAVESGIVWATTTLLHVSGGRFESPWVAFGASGTPQSVGSAITYARRYSLMATLGLATEDDDGQTAQQSAQSAPDHASSGSTRPAARPDADPTKPTVAQFRRLHALLDSLHLSNRSDGLAWISTRLDRAVESTGDLSADDVSTLIDIAEHLHATDPWAIPERDVREDEPPDGYDEQGGDDG